MHQVDVWGAAVVFYQILFGRKPFGNDVSQQQLVMDRIILNARTVEFPAKPTVGQDTKVGSEVGFGAWSLLPTAGGGWGSQCTA